MVPEQKIKEFVEKIRAAAGANLESVILYGSAAAGDYHPEFSNVNLFCVLRESSYEKLRPLAPVVKWWNRQKQPPPLFMTRSELERSADVFAIELTDMVQHYRVLWGDDVTAGLEIPMRLHRVQVEYELREKLILLRQQLLLAENDEHRIRELLMRSVASFVTLFRHALIALGETAPTTRRDAVARLSVQVGFDPLAIEQVLDVRERKIDSKKLRAFDIVGGYLEAIEKVTGAVDRLLESDVSRGS
ncbi:MAG TPA: nucleotidyltransferase domain-containing protein [Terriglobales bacterium]|nr:nucleotidyltransferase domain-containing protein [Terriglobales bacterium]